MNNHQIEIISTLGPAIAEERTLRALLHAGSAIFRQNIFYETNEEIAARTEQVKRIGSEEGIPVRVMMDFSGARPRIGHFDGSLSLRPGEVITLIREDRTPAGTRSLPSLSAPFRMDDETWKSLSEGQRVVIADGRILLQIIALEPAMVRCRIDRAAAPLRPFRGINLPDTDTSFAPLTPEEIFRLQELIRTGFDDLCLSFVNQEDDILQVRRIVEGLEPKSPVRIVAKIEDRKGVENLDQILGAADGVLVGRGDLAIQTSFPELPILQERILRQAARREIWSVVATQFMEGMMRSPVPTRAEVIDVSVAVRQGASAILLSGETARGRYPVETVSMVQAIAAEIARNK